MAQYVEGPKRSFPAGSTAIPQFSRVILSAGVLVEAGEGDVELGTVEYQQFATNFLVDLPVRLRTAEGTAKMVAAGAITSGAAVYGAASGQVTATPNKNFIGFALCAASGANSVIEVQRAHSLSSPAGQEVIEAHTADFTLTAGDSGKTLTNTGAAGDIDATLPTATVGLKFTFVLGAAQEFDILPATGDKIGTPSTSTVPATGVMGTASQGVSAAADGATLSLLCAKTGEWAVISSAGNWSTGVTS